MTFLNATLIFGVAATAVPIVLHLIARREPRKVVFPSVRFLTRRFESNRSRLRVRRWWLLALRIAAVAALAFALARPAIHQALSVTWLTIALIAALGIALLVMASVSLSRGQSAATSYALSAGAVAALLASLGWGAHTYTSGPAPAIDTVQPASIAIVLDNSPTSAWKTPSDDRIARMKDLATWMVARLPRTSRIAIVDRSAQVATFSLDVASAVSKIEQLRPLEVTQPIASRIDAAARLVRTSDLPNRQMLVITNLAVSSWDKSATEAALSALFAEDPPVALTVFDLGDFDGINRSLSIPQLADATPPRGVPIAVSATLQVDASDSAASVSATAELEIYDNDPALPVIRDGVVKRPRLQSVDRASASVAPGGSTELLLTIPSLDIGTHHGQIRLVGDDAMPLDDTRFFTLQVLAASPVLLVSDDADEARIISQALTASPGLVDESDSEFIVERIASADLLRVRLSEFAAVILLDPPTDALGDSALAEYAAGGGGILVCLGPSAGENRFESLLVPTLVRRWRAPDPGTFFQVLGGSHGVTETLSQDTPWSDFRVHQYWQLAASDDDKVLIAYAGTSHAAMTERRVPNAAGGTAGRVLVIGTPIPALSKATRSWNDLFATNPWPAWLLTRQSVEYLARRGDAQLTTAVGRPQVIRLDSSDDDTSRPGRLQLFPPGDAAPVPINVSAGAKQVTASDTSRSGTYWLRGGPPGAGFSVNLPEDAIKLERIDPAVLDQVFGPGAYSVATDREGIEFALQQATKRVSLHSPAILLALVVFLLEQILGNRFYRSRAGPA